MPQLIHIDNNYQVGDLMQFTNTQKEIIKLIEDDKVDDLLSFVQLKFKDSKIHHDIETLETRKKEDYDKRKDEIDLHVNSLRGKSYTMPTMGFNGGFETLRHTYTEEELIKLKEDLHNYKIDKSKFDKKITINGLDFSINTIKTSVYIIDDKALINDFIFIWEFLKEEKYITERKKEININDASIFFKRENIKQNQDIFLNGYKLISLNEPKDEFTIYKNNDIEYADFDLTINDDLLQICSEYIDKTIISLPKLKLFVKRNFTSNDEYAIKLSKNSIWASIIIAFISICISIGTTIKSNNDNSASKNSIEGQHIKIEKSINTKIDEIEQILNKK